MSITHNNANQTSVSWYDVTHDGNSQRITIPKRPINLYFVAFYGIIYQNLLHRRVYIGVSNQSINQSKFIFQVITEKLQYNNVVSK